MSERRLEFFNTLKAVPMTRKYAVYSIFYGLTTLIVPFATQFLVNNLALSGIWINVVTFMVIIFLGLTLSMILKYCQLLLREYIQRLIIMKESRSWINYSSQAMREYFFEIFFAHKSFAKAFTGAVDIILVLFFGLIVIMVFHPAFIILTVIIFLTMYQIWSSTKIAIDTSIAESNEKYKVYGHISSGSFKTLDELEPYLVARQDHFRFIKKNSLKVFGLFIFCQVILLGGGSFLVQANQLSIGQLVSAEIIFSGIMVSLTKLPEVMESLYDFETSKYKLSKVSHHE